MKDAETLYPDTNKLCRLCLKQHGDAYDIFDEQLSISIPIRIIACLSLEARSSDGLPKHICKECRFQLEKFYLFRQRSLLTDKKLRRHLRLISQGKKSRVFCKADADNDFDEDELEFEDSVAFICEQEKEREKVEEQSRHQYREKIYDELSKTIEAELREEITEIVRQELREKVQEEVRQEVYTEVQEECRKEQLGKLVSELEVFLSEKKAGLWETLGTVAVAPKPETGKTRKPSAKPSPTKNEVMDVYDSEGEASTEPEHEVEPTEDSIEDSPDIQIAETDAGTNNSALGGIYIINNVDPENGKSTPPSQLKLENITSYNIKDDGEIQYSEEKQEEVVLLDLGEEILTDFDQKVIILPNEKSDDCEEPLAKRKKSDFVVKQIIQDSTDPIENEGLHKTGRHTDTIKTFACATCPIKFATELSLQRHLNTHIQAEKNRKGSRNKCPLCELQLSCSSSLKRHMLIHTGVKPHKCEECGQAFVQREVLKRHMDTHTGARRFQCPHCQSRFAQKTNLQQHIAKVHLNMPVNHRCHICNRSYSHVSGLSRHLTTHAGVSFACTECGRQFSDQSSIKRHVQNVHEQKRKKKPADIYFSEGEAITGN